MAHYLMKYKGKYRILPTLDLEYHDLPRDPVSGDISQEDVELYITCQNGNKIIEYGKESNGRIILLAYIPSKGRGRNIKKAMDEQRIPYTDYLETDEEAEFKFKPKDIEQIAALLKAKTSGANISPFSVKNLPKANVEIPTGEIERYKTVTAQVQKEDLLIIHRFTTSFLSSVLAKKLRGNNRKYFDYKSEMKKLKMSRQPKEYIYTKNLWNDYLYFLEKEIKKFYLHKWR